MGNIRRYTPSLATRGGMVLDPEGPYVRHDDYAVLAGAAADLEAEFHQHQVANLEANACVREMAEIKKTAEDREAVLRAALERVDHAIKSGAGPSSCRDVVRRALGAALKPVDPTSAQTTIRP